MTKEIIKRIEVILILFAVLMVGIGVKSLAVDYTCTLTITPDTTQIKAGESVTLSIQVSDIEAGDGIAIFNTTLEYDADVFDLKVQPDSAGAWTGTVLENSITITKADYEATSADQEIGKVVLTAKQDVTLGEQTISFTKNEFSDANTTFSVEDVSTTVEIVEETNPGGNNTSGGNTNTPGGNTNTPGGNTNTPSTNTNVPSGNTNIPSGNANGGNSSVNYSNSGIVNSGKSNNILPKTGTLQNCLIGAIAIMIVIAVGFYIKYRKSY